MDVAELARVQEDSEYIRLTDIRVEQIRKELGDRIAGIYSESEDEIVFLLRGDVVVASRIEYFDGRPVRFSFREGIRYSSDEISEIRDRNIEQLGGQCRGAYAGDSSDVVNQSIVVYVIGPRVEEDGSNCYIPEAIEGVDVRIDVMPGPVIKHDARGGGNILGGAGARCTSGFSLESGGGTTTYTTTAGHCMDWPLEYSDSAGAGSFPVEYEGQVLTGYADLQWMSVPDGRDASPDFHAGPAFGVVQVRQGLRRADLRIGDAACHYGMTTGGSCGRIASTDFRPEAQGEWAIHCVPACSARWILITPDWDSLGELKCYPGDSGGPWYLRSKPGSAIGWHTGGAHPLDPDAPPEANPCIYAVASAVDYIPAELRLRTVLSIRP